MVEIDTKDGASLKNASSEELVEAFKKLDLYFDYGPRTYKLDYLEKISNVLLEIRARKSNGVRVAAKQNLEHSEN